MNKAKNMTEGSPLKIILMFSIPILLGNLLMQTYNIVDSIIVGKYVGTDAFGATSASSTIMNLFIAVLIGIGAGASIILSQLYGRQDFKRLKKAFSTSMIALMVITAIIAVTGIAFAKQIMIALKVDEVILHDAYLYLQIFFYGLIPLMIFNMYAAFLRAVGNSKVPLIFLGLTTFMNIILDLVFVIYFKLGVAGVAYATTIANFVSAVLIVIYTNMKVDFFRLTKKSDFVFDFKLLKKILVASFPVVFQSFLVSLSLVLIQSIFNECGKDYTAAYGLSGRIDAISTLPLNSIATALATFVAQNKGAGKNHRIVEGFWKSQIAMTIITFIALGLTCLFFDKIILIFLNPEDVVNSEIVVRVAKEFTFILAPFYFLIGLQFGTSNALSGASDVAAPVIIMSVSMVIRMIFAFALKGTIGYMAGIWTFPISWFFGALAAIIRFVGGKWKTKSFLEPIAEEQII